MKKEKFFGYEACVFGSEELRVRVLSLGATVQSLWYKGRQMILNYPDARSYLEGDAYICAFVGRYANRIAGAKFSLNETEYKLCANEGENQLHGGPNSWDKRVWSLESVSENSLRLSLHSPDGDNGFPGNMTASVIYTVVGSSLRMEFEGVSDKDTVYAPTSHMYFDLSGKGKALEHRMRISSSGVLEPGAGLIPTGRLLPAEECYDFGSLRPVAQDYDHCFVLDNEHACTVEYGDIRMDLYTDFPAVQLYTASALGAPHGKNAGLAIEPEFYPDSPNHPDFPSTVLKAGERFSRYAEFAFSTV